MGSNRKKFALGVALAAGIGYAAGLLTAPKSGKTTRRKLGKVALKTKREVETKIKSMHSEISDLIKTSNQKLKSLTGTAKTELQQALKTAQAAKSKARDVLSAIHEGEADDTDLDTAVKDLKKSITHLKKFAKKGSPK